MASFWLDWESGFGASIEAHDAIHALDLGEQARGIRPATARPIYFLAEPVLPGLPSSWPPYCLQPRDCAGKHYCTRSPGCDS